MENPNDSTGETILIILCVLIVFFVNCCPGVFFFLMTISTAVYLLIALIFAFAKPIRFFQAAEWLFDNFLVYVLWLPLTIILSTISIIGWSLESSAKKARENKKFIEPA
jgi:predicted membrane protein